MCIIGYLWVCAKTSGRRERDETRTRRSDCFETRPKTRDSGEGSLRAHNTIGSSYPWRIISLVLANIYIYINNDIFNKKKRSLLFIRRSSCLVSLNTPSYARARRDWFFWRRGTETQHDRTRPWAVGPRLTINR